MVKLTYLGAIIPVTLVVYALVVVLVVYLFRRQEKRYDDSTHQPALTWTLLSNKAPSLPEAFFSILPFQQTYGSLNPYGGRLLLLVTRSCSFCYVFGISGMWNWVRKDFSNLFYFTHWNLVMISVYYASAVLASLIGFFYNHKFRGGSSMMDNSWMAVERSSISAPENTAYWSAHVNRLGILIQILYEVAGGSAVFVTVVAFSFLNPQFDFWNINAHFITSMTFLLEMSQNTMIVRWHHVVLNMLWALCYLIYIWPAVATERVTDWPYPFLKVDRATCFVWYFFLFLGDAIMYFVWYYFSRLKYERVYAQSEAATVTVAEHYRAMGRRYDPSTFSSPVDNRMLSEGQDSPINRPGASDYGNNGVGGARAPEIDAKLNQKV